VSFAGYSRESLRQQYVDAYRRHQQGLPLSPLEALIADVVALHPEYQPLLVDADTAARFGGSSEPGADRDGGTNPFLHMGLHIAVREQLAIDRPPGILALHSALTRHIDPHAAEHVLVEALGETLLEAQQSGQPPDEQRYLSRVRRRLG
jgi:hypothetical protein